MRSTPADAYERTGLPGRVVFRRHLAWALYAAIWVQLPVHPPCGAAEALPGPVAARAVKPMLVACYYVWYRSAAQATDPYQGWVQPGQKAVDAAVPDAQGVSEGPRIASTAFPLAGIYDSLDPDVADWHVRLAQAAGIDAFLVSWWGTHKGLDKAWEDGIFAAAERRGFKVALLDERAQFHHDFGWYKDQLVEAVGRFKDRSAYLRIDGRPVVYLYQVAADPTLTPATFIELKGHVENIHGPLYWIVDKLEHDHAAARSGQHDREKRIPAAWLNTEGIDCFAFYSTFSHFRAWTYEDLIGKYRYLVDQAHSAGAAMLLPVHPGHDNSRFSANPFVMPRRDGQTLRDYLRAAEDAAADMIMVTSWNEWPETTVVEPSSTWGDPYGYLKILASWKGIAFEIPRPPPAAGGEAAETVR